MKEILDQTIEEKPPSKLFAKLAFATAMITLCLIGFAATIPSNVFKTMDYDQLTILYLSARAMQLTVLAGLIFSIVSLVRREKLKHLKWVGISLNFMYLILMIALIIYARILDGTL